MQSAVGVVSERAGQGRQSTVPDEKPQWPIAVVAGCALLVTMAMAGVHRVEVARHQEYMGGPTGGLLAGAAVLACALALVAYPLVPSGWVRLCVCAVLHIAAAMLACCATHAVMHAP